MQTIFKKCFIFVEQFIRSDELKILKDALQIENNFPKEEKNNFDNSKKNKKSETVYDSLLFQNTVHNSALAELGKKMKLVVLSKGFFCIINSLKNTQNMF